MLLLILLLILLLLLFLLGLFGKEVVGLYVVTQQLFTLLLHGTLVYFATISIFRILCFIEKD